MFCPVCRYEYLEGTTECNDCRVPLVEVLPPEDPKRKTSPPRLLKIASLLVIFGMSYAFIFRTLNTIFPRMFFNPYLAGANSVLFVLAQLTVVFFFVCFYREYVHHEQKKLKVAALLVILTSLIMAALNILHLVSVYFDTLTLPETSVRYTFAMIFACVAALFILYFFVVFYKTISSIPSKNLLKKATFWAAVGTVFIFLRQALSLLFYTLQSTFETVVNFSGMDIFIILPGAGIVLFSFVTILVFFIFIYKEQKQEGPEEKKS